MVLEILKQNIAAEKEIIREAFVLISQLQNIERLNPEKKIAEKKILTNSIESLREQLKIINNSLPLLIEPVSPYKKLSELPPETKNLVKVSVSSPISGQSMTIVVEKNDMNKFVKEYNLNSNLLKRLRKGERKTEEKTLDLKESGFYARTSNRIFLSLSTKLIDRGYVKRLSLNLKKINMPYLLATYLSMSFFTSFLVALGALFYFIFALFFSISLTTVIAPATVTLASVTINLAILLIAPVATFFMFYYYPYLEISSMEGAIENEIPFVTINMSAIAGSGIEPTNIFKIIASGDEYPATKKEMRKIINQVNLYGYDLVTALKNTSKETSSKKLSELLNGLATTISGGGSLTDYLNKRAETLLFDYRLSKEKETRSAETFMDLYISLVVTAPMVMTLMLILMSIGLTSGMGLSPYALSFLMIGVVAGINVIFLIALQLKSKPA